MAIAAIAFFGSVTTASADKCCQCGTGGNIWGCVTITTGSCDDADCNTIPGGCGTYTGVDDANDACPGSPTLICGGRTPGTCDRCTGVNCDDGNPCTNDSCNADTGCVHINNTSSCNDGNLCTQSDTCGNGLCAGSPVVCTPLDQCHDAGVCNTSNGQCSNPNKTNGTTCNDGNACTQTSTCQSGVCAGANPVVCDPLDQCHDAGVCNTSTGQCSNPNKINGTSCESAACDTGATCNRGYCFCPGEAPTTSAPLMSGRVLGGLAFALAALAILRLRTRRSRVGSDG